MARREAWKYWGGFFQGVGVGIEILLPYSSDDWFLQKIDPTCASSKETGVFSCVEQGLGATTSHTTQTMFAALRGVSLTCKNIPIFKLSKSRWNEQRSPNIWVFFPGQFWFLNQKSPAVFWLTLFYTFPTVRGEETEIPISIFLHEAHSQLFSMFWTKLGVVLAVEAHPHGLVALPALHTLYALSQNTDTTWKCFRLKPHGFTRLHGPCQSFSKIIHLLPWG